MNPQLVAYPGTAPADSRHRVIRDVDAPPPPLPHDLIDKPIPLGYVLALNRAQRAQPSRLMNARDTTYVALQRSLGDDPLPFLNQEQHDALAATMRDTLAMGRPVSAAWEQDLLNHAAPPPKPGHYEL